jgi:hypothetical protein
MLVKSLLFDYIPFHIKIFNINIQDEYSFILAKSYGKDSFTDSFEYFSGY